MAIASRYFVGIAEGIRSHELSTLSKIEYLEHRSLELNMERDRLQSRISYLEAAISAAYEDTDEDGCPDYSLISELEAQLTYEENALTIAETELNRTNGELDQQKIELSAVLGEKEQTLFEIQERARATAQNISIAGGMFGAYAGVGSSLQQSMQVSLSSLSQAAAILGGSTEGGGGGGGSGSRQAPAQRGSLSQGPSRTGPLSAFAIRPPSGSGPYTSGRYTTFQGSGITPAFRPGFHASGAASGHAHSAGFRSSQGTNAYASTSFSRPLQGDGSFQTGNIRSFHSAQSTNSYTSAAFGHAFQDGHSQGGTARSFHSRQSASRQEQNWSGRERPQPFRKSFRRFGRSVEGEPAAQAKADLAHYRENEGLYTYADYGEHPQMRFVDPKTVLCWQMGDEESFWSYKGRSKQEYLQMAAEIETVHLLHKTQNASYAQIAQLGGVLGACASQYFLEGAIRVEKVGDAYMFQEDGRHRLEAAIEAGVTKLPVLVVGEHKIPAFAAHQDILGRSFVIGMQKVIDATPHTDVGQLYEKYGELVSIQDIHDQTTCAHFTQGKGVSMNIDAAAKGSVIDAPYQTAFHEFGHNIDYLMGGGTPISESWGGGALLKALQEDYARLKGTRTDNELVQFLKDAAAKRGLSLMDIGNISDILESLTGISYPLGAGHGADYWKNRSPCKEFFAETLDSAAANERSYLLMKKFFPGAVAVVHKIIGGTEL